MINFVVARFGAPPDPLPPIAGIDSSTNQPDVALLRFALLADASRFPDPAAAGILDLALHAMGRARITQIDIETRKPMLDRAARGALLRQVALALVHQGASPAAILADGSRVLPHGAAERFAPIAGHVFSLVLAAPG